jgi:hypothetical protein
MNEKAISLTAELAEVRHTLSGARILADALAHDGLENRRQELDAPVSISAIIALTESRICLIERVLRGEEDPLTLWSERNDTSPDHQSGEDKDVVLQPWSRPSAGTLPTPREKQKKSTRRGRPKRTGLAPEAPPPQPEEASGQALPTEPPR